MNGSSRRRSWLRSPPVIALPVAGGLGAITLTLQHPVHTLQSLPFLLLVLCLLLHPLMHGGHGGSGGRTANHDRGEER